MTDYTPAGLKAIVADLQEMAGWQVRKSSRGTVITSPRSLVRIGNLDAVTTEDQVRDVIVKLEEIGYVPPKQTRKPTSTHDPAPVRAKAAKPAPASTEAPVVVKPRPPATVNGKPAPPKSSTRKASNTSTRRGSEIPGYDGDPLPSEGKVTLLVQVSPDLARHFLQRGWDVTLANGDKLLPRPVDPIHVNEIKTWLTEWSSAHTMLITENGTLGNGWHRCTAIAASGKTVPVLITYNASPEDILSADLGKQRRASTAMQMRGFDNPLQLGSAARLLANVTEVVLASEIGDDEGVLARTDWRSWYAVKWTTTDTMKMVDKAPGLPQDVDWAAERVKSTTRSRSFNVAAIAVFRYLVATAPDVTPADIEMRDAFLNAVISRVGIDHEEHPALRFQGWSENLKSSRYTREAHLMALIKTWNAFRTRKPITRVVLPDEYQPPIVNPTPARTRRR